MNDLGTKLHYVITPNIFSLFAFNVFCSGLFKYIFLTYLCPFSVYNFNLFFSSDYDITSASCRIQTVNIAFYNSIMFHARIIAWII